MSLGENSLVAAYQGKGQLKSRPSGTWVVTIAYLWNNNTGCHISLCRKKGVWRCVTLCE